MSEMVSTHEYAAWLAVRIQRPRRQLGEVKRRLVVEDSRPNLVPSPAYRTLFGREVGQGHQRA
jgi:hypothetical protein